MSQNPGWREPGWDEGPAWKEPGWDSFPAPAPAASAHDPVAMPSPKPPRAVVVAGAVGGAGATTSAILLGAALSEDERRKVLVLDGAPAGGDLTVRIFNSLQVPEPTWESWARSGAPASVPTAQLHGGTVGVAVLGADPTPQDKTELLATVIEAVSAEGWIVVIDGGSGALDSPALAAALKAGAALVVTVPQRADGANRTRWFLSGLTSRYGRDVVSDAIVAMVDQDGTQPHVFQTMATGLTGKVAHTIRIPADQHLAAGLNIVVTSLGSFTRSAFTALSAALTATKAAAAKPALPASP